MGALCHARQMVDWTAMAAIAGASAAIVVAWQSWETRRAANASTTAAETANSALEVARESARIGSDSLDVTRRLASEGVRARIDATTPNLTVRVQQLTPWPPLSATHPMDRNRTQTVPGTTTFRLPREASTVLILTVRVIATNNSDRTVHVAARYMAQGKFHEEERPIGPGTGELFDIEIWRTVEDWVSGTRRMQIGATTYSDDFTLAYFDPSDTGATDSWQLQADGSPLVATDGEQASYTVSTSPSVYLQQLIRRRIYYLSRLDGQLLE